MNLLLLIFISNKKTLTRLTQFKERDWNEIERKSSYWFILKKSISIVRQASLNKTYVSWRILLLYSKRGSYSRRQLAHYQSYSLLCNLAIILLIYILEKLVLVVKTIVIDNYLHVLPQFIFPFNIFLHINMLQKKKKDDKKGTKYTCVTIRKSYLQRKLIDNFQVP